MKYTFTELKQWAKSHGYDVLKEKGTEVCIWTKADDPSVSGIEETLKDTATAVFNHMTDNRWVEYQEQYKKEKQLEINFNE